jgi:N-acetylglucosaminyldiphosphoundecaprenol N-acetyl-beta-D-mannosaminyltransferase
MANKRKKVTILTMHTGFGGIERFIATLADMLSQHYDVTIIVNYGKLGNEAFHYPDNVTIKYLLPKLPDIVSLKDLLKKKDWRAIMREFGRRRTISAERRRALKMALRGIDTDIIITERAFYSNVVRKYCRRKEILRVATDHNHHQNSRKYVRELMSSVKDFDYLVVTSEELKDFYREIIEGVKCIYIPNPIDTIPDRKTSFLKKNLIAVGRFVPEKAFVDLINVMSKVHAELPETKLFLLGDGVEKSMIKSRVKKLGLEKVVTMPGFVCHEKVAPYFYDSSLFVLTSHTEAFGLVLTEAMSYGLPCVAFDSASGARAQVKPDVGVLIKKRDEEKMAGAIVNLLQDVGTMKKYQKQINKNICAYSKTALLKDWAKILGG